MSFCSLTRCSAWATASASRRVLVARSGRPWAWATIAAARRWPFGSFLTKSVLSLRTDPALLLEKLGIHVQGLTYVYSRFRLNWANFLVHFSFSTVCASFYAVVAEYNPRIKFLQGAAFGIVVWVVSHLLIMPILRLTAATLRPPFEENLSECFGHAVWMWSIEMVRRVCWLLVVSVGQNGPVRTPHPIPCFLPIAQRKSTISSIDSLIFTEGEWTLCTGFSPSSRG